MTFSSIYHPGHAPLSLVIARAQVQPVALTLLGVFTVAFVGILRGEVVLETMLWAAPLAYVLAAAWSVYRLHQRPAELIVHNGFGAMRSVWDVARDREVPLEKIGERIRLEPVFRPFRKDGYVHAGVGDEVHTFRPTEWPAYSELVSALKDSTEVSTTV